MNMAEGGDERPTSVEDLQGVLGCWTRRNILIALSGPRRCAQDLADLLGITPNHLSNHTRALRGLGLARVESEGLKHYWGLDRAASIIWGADGVELVLRATDGGRVNQFIAYSSASMRLIEPALRARGHAGQVNGARSASVRGRTPSAPIAAHRPSERG